MLPSAAVVTDYVDMGIDVLEIEGSAAVPQRSSPIPINKVLHGAENAPKHGEFRKLRPKGNIIFTPKRCTLVQINRLLAVFSVIGAKYKNSS